MTTIQEQPEAKRPLRTILLVIGGLIIGIGLAWLLINWLVPPTYNGQEFNSKIPLPTSPMQIVTEIVHKQAP